jgi:hypothetical protein
MEPMKSVSKLDNEFFAWTKQWERGESPGESSNGDLLRLAEELHRCNYRIWNNEDIARRQDLPDGELRKVKNAVDVLNQKRNDTIEQIDEFLLQNYFSHLADADLPIRTETPGSALDRLSVLSLKIYRMREQTKRKDVDGAHIILCTKKLSILMQQMADLQEAIRQVLQDLEQGRIKMKLYRQFKMYNDPNLNPALYTNGAKLNKQD